MFLSSPSSFASQGLSTMDWTAAKSYYIGYNALDRFNSIVFVHSYLLTGSIALFFALLLPCLSVFSPSSLQTQRTSHLLLVCLVCLSNIGCIYVQAYLVSSAGEPNLSFHPCRLLIFLSSLAKPAGLYLTFLFTIERFFTKIFSRFFFQSVLHYRQFGRRVFTLLIYLFIVLIVSIRLYQVLTLIGRNSAPSVSVSSESIVDLFADIDDTSSNSSDRNITFRFCFQSMNVDTYGKILSFYVLQEWYEQLTIVGIIFFFVIFLISQCCLSRMERMPSPSSSRSFSANTKLYLILASCVTISEVIVVFFHLIVDDVNNNNTNLQLTSLQFMLFAFNFRTFVLPLMVCFILSHPLKEFLGELLFVRPYLENIDDTDQSNDRPEPFSSSQRTSHGRLRAKLRRPFARNNGNHQEYLGEEDISGNL